MLEVCVFFSESYKFKLEVDFKRLVFNILFSWSLSIILVYWVE